MGISGLLTAVLASLAAQTAPAGPATGAEPLRALEQCRALNNDRERLRCFDREVAAVVAARARGEVVVAGREEVRRARGSLFGLNLPKLRIFGDERQADRIDRVEGVIRSATLGDRGRWTLVLEDGARWQQTEARGLGRDPRPGQPVSIRRGALGSYLASVNGQIAIRVRRVN